MNILSNYRALLMPIGSTVMYIPVYFIFKAIPQHSQVFGGLPLSLIFLVSVLVMSWCWFEFSDPLSDKKELSFYMKKIALLVLFLAFPVVLYMLILFTAIYPMGLSNSIYVDLNKWFCIILMVFIVIHFLYRRP